MAVVFTVLAIAIAIAIVTVIVMMVLCHYLQRERLNAKVFCKFIRIKNLSLGTTRVLNVCVYFDFDKHHRIVCRQSVEAVAAAAADTIVWHYSVMLETAICMLLILKLLQTMMMMENQGNILK